MPPGAHHCSSLCLPFPCARPPSCSPASAPSLGGEPPVSSNIRDHSNRCTLQTPDAERCGDRPVSGQWQEQDWVSGLPGSRLEAYLPLGACPGSGLALHLAGSAVAQGPPARLGSPGGWSAGAVSHCRSTAHWEAGCRGASKEGCISGQMHFVVEGSQGWWGGYCVPRSRHRIPRGWSRRGSGPMPPAHEHLVQGLGL